MNVAHDTVTPHPTRWRPVEIRRQYREDKEKVTRRHDLETCPEQDLSVPFEVIDARRVGWIYNFGIRGVRRAVSLAL